MPDIIVTGHKNPDMDSVCAAWCYADFKSKIDKNNTYLPVRCGKLNNQTKAAFEEAGIEAPRFIKDVSPKVADVTRRDIVTLDVDEPVLKAIKILDEENISCIPVFEDCTRFMGIISIHQISGFLISENLGRRPVYRFRINNFQKVLPGFFYKRGDLSEFSAPVMTGAMPVDVSISRIEALKPDKPVLVVGLREKLIRTAIENDFPAIILTGVEDNKLPVDFTGYNGSVFVSKADTAETIRLLRLSAPVKDIMNSKPLIIASDSDFDKAKDTLVNSNYRGLPVFEDDNFTGIVTRRCFIEKPVKKLILVDHNETSQSVPGAEQAEIIEIIDHHRISPQPTKTPIYMNIRPVGSTCTIIYGHYKNAGLKISRQAAMLLLAGILSDTLILRSPTTTDEDRETAAALSELCECDTEEYGRRLLEKSAVLDSTPPYELITSDFKEYAEGEFRFGVGQAETVNLVGLEGLKEKLVAELEKVRLKKNLDWAMLLITDVIKENSVMITTDLPAAEELLIYKKMEDNLFDLSGVLSRKKQLLPELLRVIEEGKLGE